MPQLSGSEQTSLLQVELESASSLGHRAAWTRTMKARRFGLIAGGFAAVLLVAGASFSVHGDSARHSRAASRGAVAELSSAKGGVADCTMGRDNCNVTKCCAGPGLQCYEQNGYYAQCRPSCIEGAPDVTHWDGKKWSCKELGVRSGGKPACGTPGEDCSESQCCADPGMQCYEKVKGWSTCKAECTAGAPDMTDLDGTPWNCKKLGERSPGMAPWVQGQCSVNWDNCLETMCCKNPGEICHKQSDGFGECKVPGTCNGPDWTCETAGPMTPTSAQKGGMVPKWALKTCGRLNEGCSESRCCLGMEVQCYSKNKKWAQCLQRCEPGKHAGDLDTEPWDCQEMGPRSYGLATKGFPSLYCFSVLRTEGYEAELIKASADRKAGIFACDDLSLLTADGSITIGDQKSIQFPGAEIVTSIDGTAGNTDLFVNAWTAVIGANKWRDHAFTAKVDPDAVFVPDKLRLHVQHYVGDKMYVVNCHVGDMMYGALEVFSFAAIEAWAELKDTCNAPNNYGEDKYMTQCMDHLDVTRVTDEGVMGDKLCGTFTDCGNEVNSIFHPFKDLASWTECMDMAMR